MQYDHVRIIAKCLEVSLWVGHSLFNIFIFSGEFKSIKSVNGNFTKAELTFNNNWVTFLDSLFQFEVLSKNNSGISKPKHIETLEIDLNAFNCINDNKEAVKAVRYAMHGVTR